MPLQLPNGHGIVHLVDKQILKHIYHRKMGGLDRFHSRLQIIQVGRQSDGIGKTDGQLVQLRLFGHFN
ncbi:hypothetical protein D3C81_2167370 [compost metagenome]